METKKIKSNRRFAIIITATFFLSSFISVKTIIALNKKVNEEGITVERAMQDNGKIDAAKKKLKESKNVKADCEKMITEYIKENDKLQTENNSLRRSTNNLSQEIENLKKKLEVAKILKIYDIEIIGYKVAKKDSKPSDKAKEINRISSIFEIAENFLAEPGSKEIYIVIYDTKGLVLGTQTNKFANKSNQKAQVYSALKSVEYENLKTKVNIDFDCKQKLVKGKYKVDIYIDGTYSEKKEFVLK